MLTNLYKMHTYIVIATFCILQYEMEEHIISDPKILIGKPTIKGTCISVELILELFALGWTEEQISDSYPSLSSESLRAVFA